MFLERFQHKDVVVGGNVKKWMGTKLGYYYKWS